MSGELVEDAEDGIWLGHLSMAGVFQLFALSAAVQKNNSLFQEHERQPQKHKSSPDDNDIAKKSVVVGFVYFWSSWCHRRLQSDFIGGEIRPALEELVHQLVEQHQQQHILAWKWKEVTLVCGHVQIDESEESLDLYIGDNSHNNNNNNNVPGSSSGCIVKNPCPPEEFPALAVVIQTRTSTHAFLHYMTSFQTIWGKHGHPHDRVIMTGDWIAAVIEELDHLPKEFAANFRLENTIMTLHALHDSGDDDDDVAIRIFVAGDRSSVGKSSVCLGILGYLIQSMGYAPSSLAYIKPATQCEAPQLVQAYCDQVGIECVPVGPIVYYKGFTRAFLAGETESTAELLAKASHAVDRLARGKKIILIDGVGFPAVGSICGTDNATMARVCGYITHTHTTTNNNINDQSTTATTPTRHPVPVLLIGGSGVGAAVDAFQLNATYFEMHNVPVMGAIFNKLDLEGFYSLENCRSQVSTFFSQNQHQQRLGRQPFGFVPQFSGFSASSPGLDQVDEWIRLFGEHVNIPGILHAAKRVKEQLHKVPAPTSEDGVANARTFSGQLAKKIKLSPPAPLLSTASRGKRFLSRKEIEQRALVAGAAPSA